ncbi:MAG TPA: ABC transporter permease [Thermomicrobiales bacterium]|nr:ABC transporter permease [Thermomicrobiales bacterium]
MFLRYVARRVAMSVPVLLAVIFITYGMAIFGPGDPVATMVGQTEQRNNQELIARLRHQHGYDRSFVVQYVDYVGKLVRGDWGEGVSIQYQGRSVRSLILQALPVSFQLGAVALLILFGVGVPLGVLAALKQNSWLDRVIVTFSILADSIPSFVLAPVLLVFLVLKTHLIDSAIGWDGVFSQKIILPALILALSPMLLIVRQTRFAIIEVMQQEYVRTARAKGLGARAIVWRHVLKNALQPVITLAGLIAAYLLTGAIFIEQIFGIPGMGQLIVQGLRRNDLPLLMGTTIVGAAIVLISNLVVDVLYAVFDPRIRYG